MKKIIALLFVTALVSTTALANNDVPPRGDDPKEEKSAEYKVSLTNHFFNLFNIFSIEPITTDTLKREEEISKPVIER